ncbi:MAG: T9SS type A sorting domain-containing protein [candidate division Zixibacteria bacterium]|nr:T9SS type A sorting domain-containing protein [candidate division Zixibacteria bacterium]
MNQKFFNCLKRSIQMSPLIVKSSCKYLFAIIPVFVFLFLQSAYGDAIFVNGDVSGTWSADTVVVTDSIRIPDGEMLTIEPGTEVLFLGSTAFVIDNNAILHAVGTQQDTIEFRPFTPEQRLLGFDFLSCSDQTTLEYCHLKKSIWSCIRCDNSSITIRNSLIDSCHAYSANNSGGGAIELKNSSDALIEGNTIRDNESNKRGGGIYSYQSSPIITGNTIQNNVVGDLTSAYGGGICCIESGPQITGNVILDNLADPSGIFSQVYGYGAGIYIEDNNGVDILIAENIIGGNTVVWGANSDGYGGGIYIRTSDINVTLANNTIVDNTVEHNHGGGIYVGCHDLVLEDNLIDGNTAGEYGGGIYIEFCSSGVFEGNIITNNRSVDYSGGGISMEFGYPMMDKNTIAYNIAPDFGGGIHCLSPSGPIITNSIIYFNSAGEGSQIWQEASGVEVTYSDIQGGWSGMGNIDADPRFVDPDNGYFDLQHTSPCIDTGDPDTNDPDGTISDMGAKYFRQYELIVSMTPEDAPISVPAGGSFRYEGYLKNNTNQMMTSDVWVNLILPDGNLYGPIKQFNDVPLDAQEEIIISNVNQNIPMYAPSGIYGYRAFCGEFPDMKTDSAEFGFTVTFPLANGTSEWTLSEWFDKNEEASADKNSPVNHVLINNHPNPFNASTQISFELSEAEEVSLDIYNLRGQRVENLISGRKEAGRHTISWNASSHSSGIYFIKMAAGTNHLTKQITVLK